MRSALRVGGGILGIAAVFVIGIMAGRASKEPERVVLTVRDTVESPELLARAEQWRLEAEGWRARLRGVRVQEPETVYVARDSIPIQPVVFETVAGRPTGRAMASVLVLNPDSTTYSRRLDTGYDLSRCQDFHLSPAGFVCDEPALGILELGASALVEGVHGDAVGLGGEATLEWRRFRTSPLSVVAGYGHDGRWFLGATYRITLIGR